MLGTVSCLVIGEAVGATKDAGKTDVWVAGRDGYHTYRIPSVIGTPGGALLAFCEGRRGGRGDSGDIDLLMKRSTDGGRTWGPQQVIWDDAANTCGNPCPVVDRTTGVIWLPLTHNLGSDTESAIKARTAKGTRTVWLTQSQDDGRTWEKPREITREAKRDVWGWYATGPGVGIQTRSGRLVIPCDHSDENGAFRSHVIYSDDHGRSWKLGAATEEKTNECQVVERRDGSLLLNMRSYHGHNQRALAISADRGETWGRVSLEPTLIEPVCQASLLRIPGREAAGDVWLFSNPASSRRERMTVRMSRDEGRTWLTGSLIHEGPSAYSCLVALGDGMAGCLYENGATGPYERISFARFAA